MGEGLNEQKTDGPMTEKTAESQLVERFNCRSTKKNQMKQYVASFKTKLLNYKICFNSQAARNLKILPFLIYFAEYFCRFHIWPKLLLSPWKSSFFGIMKLID